jgi:hypothetical protein
VDSRTTEYNLIQSFPLTGGPVVDNVAAPFFTNSTIGGAPLAMSIGKDISKSMELPLYVSEPVPPNRVQDYVFKQQLSDSNISTVH